MDYKLNIKNLDDPQAIKTLVSAISEIADQLDIMYSETAPNGNISARVGRVCLYNNSGTYEQWENIDGGITWQQTILSGGAYSQPSGGPYTTFLTFNARNDLASSVPPIVINNYNTGYGMVINNYCDDDVGGTGAGLQVRIKGDNTTNGIYVVLESTTAIQFGINIDNNTDAGYGIMLYNIGSGTGINISNWDTSSLGVALDILNCVNNPTGDVTDPAAFKGINIFNVSASGGYGINITNKGTSSGGTGIQIYNGESGVGESVGLYINNNSSNYGLKIDHVAGDAGLYINGTAATSPLLIVQNGAAPCIAISQSGAGYDITGTGTNWYMDKAGNAVMESIYLVGDCSALTFTDRTPGYEGEAIKELSKIKSKNWKINHATMPDFMKAIKKDGTVERNLGNTITMLIKAVQELDAKIEALSN